MSPGLAAVNISTKDLQAARNQRRRELGQQLIARPSVVDIITETRPLPVPVSPIENPGDKARPDRIRIKLYRED